MPKCRRPPLSGFGAGNGSDALPHPFMRRSFEILVLYVGDHVQTALMSAALIFRL